MVLGREDRVASNLLRDYLKHVERHRVDVGSPRDRIVIELPETAVIERLRDASPGEVTVSVSAAGKTGRARLRLV